MGLRLWYRADGSRESLRVVCEMLVSLSGCFCFIRYPNYQLDSCNGTDPRAKRQCFEFSFRLSACLYDVRSCLVQTVINDPAWEKKRDALEVGFHADDTIYVTCYTYK